MNKSILWKIVTGYFFLHHMVWGAYLVYHGEDIFLHYSKPVDMDLPARQMVLDILYFGAAMFWTLCVGSLYLYWYVLIARSWVGTSAGRNLSNNTVAFAVLARIRKITLHC